jgi:hypothetical protein
MTITTDPRQGRAPGLYDEQLQRQQQEKSLFGRYGGEARRGLLGAAIPGRAVPPQPEGSEG